ncbi:histidine--tRNA ligase [Candidatus Woesebacteria bacterium RBG_16_40_11]|uniref:Histidine--tRNA ligase n=1 Tax=Candidatus Woesebacteria bacterium RIFCSPHIGHO2_01_FULL_40_22 TaxID=1802499 RepID=A0A1F7YIZ7_9BACT|nr:MAG: histidine--tRNA ligase [Candidatus Woesebacteria bacterium RBG_16_40_11]OGM27324.1 MAG: histidine--tRNA ligase [Candidatus Woesebacteria bacterium RIFCSPHIGHO2_01_FULL_40_22]
MNKTMLQPLKGFRDFYPEDMAFQRWFYNLIKEISESFGYQEYEGPMVEPLDLYAAKSGEELVKKQAFTWKDVSDRTLALRPEITPTLARMITQKEGSLTFPVKWFTYGRRFRYEQPQKGRGREFFQWDIDVLGSDSPESDAEIIAIAGTFYQKLGLTPAEVKIKINDRKFLQDKLTEIGIAQEKITPLFRIIDKKSKVDEKAFREMVNTETGNADITDKVIDILNDKESYKTSDWLTKMFNILEAMNLRDYVEFDPAIVRGLDYYTRTVFESWDVKGDFRAIWGGGRYDNLTEDIGSNQKIPGVGFALGDMVISELLKTNGKFPTLKTNTSSVLVTIFSPELQNDALKLSLKLRLGGINTELYSDPTSKLDKQLKYADKKGIPWVVIIGPDEKEKGIVVLKNMKTNSQETLTPEEAVAKIKTA